MPSSTRRHNVIVYLLTLFLTAILWLVILLSDHNTYPVRVSISWQGFDTVSNVVVQADSVLTLDIVSNGFSAFSRNRQSRRQVVVIHTTGDTLIKTADCVDSIVRQMDFSGIHGVTCRQESIRLRLKHRYYKKFVPQLRGLDVTFAEAYGLYGDIIVSPDTVKLYGSKESLEKIHELYTLPMELKNIQGSKTYKVPLSPVWKQYPDVRVASKMVDVSINAERYAEKTFKLPLAVEGGDTSVRVKLYPETVEVDVWISERDYSKISDDMFQAKVVYDTSMLQWGVVLSQFPGYARVKTIRPETVQYVVIK